MKEKLFRLKKGSQGMYLFQNVKGITKMAFPHFKRKQLWSINFDLVKCDGLIFAKMHFMGHEQRVHYVSLFIHLKNTWFKSHGVRVFIHFIFFIFSFFIFFWFIIVTSMMELLDSIVILQVECWKYHFWKNIKLFFWNQNTRSSFQNSNREMDFGTRDELRLWDHPRLQRCIRKLL